MQVYILLALSNFAYGFLIRNNTATDFKSADRLKESSIDDSISLLKEQDRKPGERENSVNNQIKTIEQQNYLLNINNQNNKYISITKREANDLVKEDKTTITDKKGVLLINKASDQHEKINETESNEKNKDGHKNDSFNINDASTNEDKQIKQRDNLNAEYNQTTVKPESEGETEKAKVTSEEVNVRSRRSTPVFMKLLKKLFVKTKATENIITTPTSITGQTLIDEETNDTENNSIVVDKQNIDNLVSKLDKVLQIFNDRISDDQYTDGIIFITVKIPLALDSLHKQRFKRDVKPTKLTEEEQLQDNATEKHYDTNTTKDIAQQIELNFKEMQDKLAPIKAMKDKFSSQDIYKVGYIIANLETLELTLKKMVDYLSSKEWSGTRAQKILDKIQLSKAVASNLIRHLEVYSKSKSEQKTTVI